MTKRLALLKVYSSFFGIMKGLFIEFNFMVCAWFTLAWVTIIFFRCAWNL